MTTWILVAGPVEPESALEYSLADLASRTRSLNKKPATSWWSATPRNTYTRGDQVVLWLRRNRRLGVIGQGRIVDPNPIQVEKTPGGHTSFIGVQWDVVLPFDKLLPRKEVAAVVERTPVPPLRSGQQVDPSDERAWEDLWESHLEFLGATARMHPLVSEMPEDVDEEFDERNDDEPEVEIPRGYGTAKKKIRLHQQRFRDLLLRHYPAECSYCQIRVIELLEAAHLVPDSEGGAASIANGRILCANHHLALDRGILSWDGTNFIQVEGMPIV